MYYKRIKIGIIFFFMFLIVFISLKCSQAHRHPNEDDRDIELIENNLVQENFIQIKEKEEINRSVDSRRKKSISKVLKTAYKEIGKPYSYGDIGPSSYDCSGLIYSIYLNSLNIKLNRTSKDQSKNGYEVEKNDLIPGDLVFFNTIGDDISHVGIYIGGGEMIHSSLKSKKIIVTDIDSNYFKSRYVTARRIIR